MAALVQRVIILGKTTIKNIYDLQLPVMISWYIFVPLVLRAWRPLLLPSFPKEILLKDQYNIFMQIFLIFNSCDLNSHCITLNRFLLHRVSICDM